MLVNMQHLAHKVENVPDWHPQNQTNVMAVYAHNAIVCCQVSPTMQ